MVNHVGGDLKFDSRPYFGGVYKWKSGLAAIRLGAQHELFFVVQCIDALRIR